MVRGAGNGRIAVWTEGDAGDGRSVAMWQAPGDERGLAAFLDARHPHARLAFLAAGEKSAARSRDTVDDVGVFLSAQHAGWFSLRRAPEQDGTARAGG